MAFFKEALDQNTDRISFLNPLLRKIVEYSIGEYKRLQIMSRFNPRPGQGTDIGQYSSGYCLNVQAT